MRGSRAPASGGCSQRATSEPIGLDRDGVVAGARDVEGRCDADVDREDVVGDGRPVAAQDPAAGQVEAGGRVVEESGPGEARQRTEVYVRLVEAVVARDQAR